MSEQVSLLFARLAELAAAEGDVPADGSGIDGVWTTTVPARDRDRDWNVAMNADTDQEHTFEGFPGEEDESFIRPLSATIWLGRTPVGAFGPFGGELTFEQTDDGPQSIEDELISDVDARIEALEAGDGDE